MKSVITTCLSLVFIAGSALAADPAAFVEREAKIEHAATRVDADLLAEQVGGLENELAAAPSDPGLLYQRALAHYAEASLARAHKDMKTAEAQIGAALKQLEQIKESSWQAEVLGLEGYLNNQLIGVKGAMSAMKLGPKSSSLLAQAIGKAPDNPRVLFFRGISLVTTPEMWGGDVAQGIDLLERADKKFASQSADAPLHWGRAESLAWLGMAKQKNGDTAGARAAWERALAVEPEYGWVKYVLLPSLETASEKSGK